MTRCAEREGELVVSGPGTGRDSADGLLCFCDLCLEPGSQSLGPRSRLVPMAP